MDVRQTGMKNAYQLINFLRSQKSSTELSQILSGRLLICYKPMCYKKASNGINTVSFSENELTRGKDISTGPVNAHRKINSHKNACFQFDNKISLSCRP